MSILMNIETQLYSRFKPKSISHILGLEETALSLCSSLIIRYFLACGLPVRKGCTCLHSDVLLQLCSDKKLQRMSLFFIQFLRQQGILSSNEEEGFLKESFPAPEEILGKIRILYPKFYQFFSFLEKCTRSYSEVLSGKVSASQILFPVEDPFILKKIYDSTPKIGYEELYLHFAKEYIVHHMRPGASLIEIGAGQGLLSNILLPEVHERLGRYLFTDIGSSFLKDASRDLQPLYPKMSTCLLDASQDPASQGLECESFDCLVGFNVVHATPDVAQTIAHSSRLVKKGGSICLVENVRGQPWIDMIYGMTHGWWMFDDACRTTSPLLSIDQWEKIPLPPECRLSVFPVSTHNRQETDSALIIIQKGGCS